MCCVKRLADNWLALAILARVGAQPLSSRLVLLRGRRRTKSAPHHLVEVALLHPHFVGGLRIGLRHPIHVLSVIDIEDHHLVRVAPHHVQNAVSKDRWLYYVNERLESDRIILSKFGYSKPLSNWIGLIVPLGLRPSEISSKLGRALIAATNERNSARVAVIASQMFEASVS